MLIIKDGDGAWILSYQEATGLVIYNFVDAIFVFIALSLLPILVILWLEMLGIPVMRKTLRMHTRIRTKIRRIKEMYMNLLKNPRRIPLILLTQVKEIYYPAKRLESKEDADKYCRKISESKIFNPEKLDNIEEYQSIADSEGFPDREIVKLGDTYKTLEKGQYNEHDYIYLDRGRVVGRYVPVKRVHPDKHTPLTQTEVLYHYESLARHTLITSHRRMKVHKKTWDLLEDGDRIVVADHDVIGYIEPKPKW